MTKIDPPENVHAVGLDIGGTKIAAGLVSFPSGTIVADLTVPTEARCGGPAVLAKSRAAAQELIERAAAMGAAVPAIGIGVPELVDLEGSITSAYNFDWRDISVAEEFSTLLPAVVEADVRAAALAEAQFGAGRGRRVFLYVTVGTGISCCLVQDGMPFRGARGNALAFASSPLTTQCGECGATQKPVLEAIASGPGLVNSYNTTGGVATKAEQVFAAAENGDGTAQRVLESAGSSLGVSVGLLVNALDPEAVIVGGGLGMVTGAYWASFVSATRAHVWSPATAALPIERAGLGREAGVIGAAFRALDLLDAPTLQQAPVFQSAGRKLSRS